MNYEPINWLVIAPEVFLLAAICVVLLIDLFVAREQRWMTYLAAQAAIAGSIVILMLSAPSSTQFAFHGTVVRDGMADLMKLAILLVSMTVLLYSRDYLAMRNLKRGEYYVLALFAVLGMLIMVSGYSFITLYLGLELLSLSLYALVAFDRDNGVATEAAMKYFVLGAIASGLLLYGMSIAYGLTGSLQITAVHDALVLESSESRMAVAFALVFVMAGLAFKLGLVPFHMWVPDVYEGAPASVTLLISSAPKIAALAMVFRLIVDGFSPLVSDWQGMFVILAVLSIGLGNVVAIAQRNVRRMLAYSTIAQIGFLVMGVLAGTQGGLASSIFYVLVYAATSAGAFGVLTVLSRRGAECETLDDLAGLSKRHPGLAVLLMLLMLSMAGIPMTAGFYAKVLVIQSVIAVEMVWLAVYAVVMSVIGAFYYLRVIRMMYFEAHAATDFAKPVVAIDTSMALALNGMVVLGLGILPGGLLNWCLSVVR